MILELIQNNHHHRPPITQLGNSGGPRRVTGSCNGCVDRGTALRSTRQRRRKSPISKYAR